jgi:Uma2 family endonuclease
LKRQAPGYRHPALPKTLCQSSELWYTKKGGNMADALQDHLFAYADYKSWELKEGERYELIDGVAYAMAGPTDYHQSISGELFRQIANYLDGKPCKVRAAPYDVRLFYQEDESDDTVVQPDVMIICDKNKLGKEGCCGAPDFVTEILSPSNTAIEMERKFDLYLKAGVREYWVIDPERKGVKAYTFKDDQIFTRNYKSADLVSVELIPGLDIVLEKVFAE